MYSVASRNAYMQWLETFRPTIGAPETHKTSPIVWFDDGMKYLGGRDDTLAWCRKMLSTNDDVDSASGAENVDPWNPDHGFQYDLVVIGGGSGGLACSKEAQKLGAKVAVLDFVKPSPLGSKWGLGGTCVNVGCIPKKLMHNAALLGEHIKDSKGYGWNGEVPAHNWESLRENVQDYIKGLNFGYRVQLREAGITYYNKLGKFLGPNQLELTDAKGKTETITAARFVLATGGRPTPLDFPGAEHCLSSDDIFMKETAPGRTCVIGAGYVALECAGFLTGLKQGDVTVLVRSVPLRTFDQDVVKYISDYMTHSGTRLVLGVTPKSIEKLANGRYLVSYGDESEEFDTVLQAVGRTPDLKGLNVDAIRAGGVSVDERSGKVVCANEQTSIPHVYAIGDIVHGTPELTPVAILAGKLLARRLFGGSSEKMNYKLIPTAVFTPLELGTVGLSEVEAVAKYGEPAIECYVSVFTPLEWNLTNNHSELSCYAKIVVNKSDKNKVVGMHIAAPNAGEIIQGFAVGLKKGITYEDLLNTVGIHPTIGEEFTVLTVAKSSGASAAKKGC